MTLWADFHFLRPWWLALLPVGVWLIWQLLRGRADSGGWRSVVDAPLRAHVLAEPEVLRESRWPLIAALASWLLAVVALAGPAWERLPVPAFRSEEALVVALDLSRSMDATDVEPSRLARARLKLLDLLERRTAGQTALVVFSTHAFTVTPLTTDTRTIAALAGAVNTDIMPTQGSTLSSGLEKGATLLRQTGLNQGEILAITDADVTREDLSLAGDLRGEGFRVSVLAVGTEQGAPIARREGGFLTDDNGQVVIPQLDAAGLQRLAAAGGGRFARLAPDDRDLASLFPAAGLPASAELEAAGEQYKADVWRDRGLLLALALLPFLALSFRRGWICAWLVVLALPTSRADAFEWAQLWQRPDQRGYEALQSEPTPSAPRSCSRIRSGAAPRSTARVSSRRAPRTSTASTLPTAITIAATRSRRRAGSRRRSARTTARSRSTRITRTRPTTAIFSRTSSRRIRSSSNRTSSRAAISKNQQRDENGSSGSDDQANGDKSQGSEQQGDQVARPASERVAERSGSGLAGSASARRGRHERRPVRASRERSRRAATAAGRGRRAAGRREVGVRAGRGAMAPADPAGSGRPVAPQVPISVSALRRRSRRQVGVERRAKEAMVSRFVRCRALAALAAAALGAVGAAAPRPALAQDAVLQASVDRPVVRDNESFTYTIRAEGAVRGEPELAAVKQQFDVLASQSEKRVGIINGRTSQVTTWTFQLMPKSVGEFTLPPAADRRAARRMPLPCASRPPRRRAPRRPTSSWSSKPSRRPCTRSRR